jgi:HD-like signal output (HDOD) protein/CheY-like chemotaxis protein
VVSVPDEGSYRAAKMQQGEQAGRNVAAGPCHDESLFQGDAGPIPNRPGPLIFLLEPDSSQRVEWVERLRQIDPSWSVPGFGDLAEALTQIKTQSPHLVLAADGFAGLSGSQVLDLVRQANPSTVRIVITRHGHKPNRLAAAHQYLSEPVEPGDVENRIRQALAAQQALQVPALATLAGEITSFPALPCVYADLVREFEDENANLERAVELLEQDGGILTRVIQAANSWLYGGTVSISDPKAALFHLGTLNVEALVVSMHVFKGYVRTHFPEMPVELLWRHSLGAACLARELCRKVLGDREGNDAFFAGLVHDLGCLILMENYPQQFRAVCQRAHLERKPLHDAEREMFQAAHEELSAFMLRLWGLPDAVVQAVTYHWEPWASPDAQRFSPTVALYMANVFTRQQNPHDRLPTPELNLEYLQAVQAPDLGSATRLLKSD